MHLFLLTDCLSCVPWIERVCCERSCQVATLLPKSPDYNSCLANRFSMLLPLTSSQTPPAFPVSNSDSQACVTRCLSQSLHSETISGSAWLVHVVACRSRAQRPVTTQIPKPVSPAASNNLCIASHSETISRSSCVFCSWRRLLPGAGACLLLVYSREITG